MVLYSEVLWGTLPVLCPNHSFRSMHLSGKQQTRGTITPIAERTITSICAFNSVGFRVSCFCPFLQNKGLAKQVINLYSVSHGRAFRQRAREVGGIVDPLVTTLQVVLNNKSAVVITLRSSSTYGMQNSKV